MAKTEMERFWARVEKTDGCWLWTGAQGGTGYGRFYAGPERRSVPAHRVSYEHAVGPVPEGLVLDHLCRVRHCVNPAHLEAVTDRVNILRGFTAPARNVMKTHCDHGHEFTPENTKSKRSRNGKMEWRECRACAIAAQRKWRRSRSETTA